MKLEFPKAEIQVYGKHRVVYSNYLYELENAVRDISKLVASRVSCFARAVGKSGGTWIAESDTFVQIHREGAHNERNVGVGTLVLLLATGLLAAEDLRKMVSTFNMTLDGQTREDALYMVLKQSGTELHGHCRAKRLITQWPILKGKIEEPKSPEVQTDEPLIN